jgi:hypothetical protein
MQKRSALGITFTVWEILAGCPVTWDIYRLLFSWANGKHQAAMFAMATTTTLTQLELHSLQLPRWWYLPVYGSLSSNTVSLISLQWLDGFLHFFAWYMRYPGKQLLLIKIFRPDFVKTSYSSRVSTVQNLRKLLSWYCLIPYHFGLLSIEINVEKNDWSWSPVWARNWRSITVRIKIFQVQSREIILLKNHIFK